MKRLILFFYVLVSCTGILAQPFLNAADEKLKAFVTVTKVPGLSISISKKGALIYSAGFGFEDVENNGHEVTDDSTNNYTGHKYNSGYIFCCLLLIQFTKKGSIAKCFVQ